MPILALEPKPLIIFSLLKPFPVSLWGHLFGTLMQIQFQWQYEQSSFQVPDLQHHRKPKARRSEVTLGRSCKSKMPEKDMKQKEKMETFLCFCSPTHPLPSPSSLNLHLSISFTCSHSDSGLFIFLSFPLYSTFSRFVTHSPRSLHSFLHPLLSFLPNAPLLF